MSKQISFNANDTALNVVNNIMTKYKYNQTEALVYICECHEEHEKNINDWYRKLLLNLTLDLTNAINVAKKEGNFTLIENVMEEFTCRIL